MILPPLALMQLAWFKLRGALRRALRRLRQPAGLVFALLGGGMIALWLSSIFVGSGLMEREAPDPERVRNGARMVGALLTFLGASSALNHRGLFLPAEEVERLFSAPLSRAGLVRYRLGVGAVRSLFASLLVGVLTARRAPEPWIAFLGVLLGMQAIGVIAQLTALAAGAVEQRLLRRLARGWFVALVLLGLGLGFFLAFQLTDADPRALPEAVRGLQLSDLTSHPLFRALTLPFEPWAQVVAAPSWAVAGPWLLVCLGAWLFLWELCARLPIDYRELSLQTSASVSERIRRSRTLGGSASGARLDPGSATRRVPWVFGRGPMGAVAWRKLVGMARKARGTLFVSLAVLVLLSVLGSVVVEEGGERGVLFGSLLIAGMGTVYLSGGLRFDFREELERMEQHKSWPLAPARIFAATLLPQVLLISALLWLGMGVLAAVSGHSHPGQLYVAALLPLFVATWAAIDNALFLLAPVRALPGQEGVLHNAGRSMVLMLVRLVFLALTAAALALVLGPTAWALHRMSELSSSAVNLVLGAEAAAVLGLLVGVLIHLGGRALARFDVARDRA